MAELSPGAVIDSRFRVDEPLETAGGEASFLGTDQNTSARVVLHRIGADELDAVKALRGVNHAHLADVLDLVVEADGSGVLVVEHVPGVTLADRLEHVGKKEPVEAVRYALRIADALSQLHAVSAAHGAVHLRSVVMEPEGDRAGPVLTFGPPRRTIAPHRSPGRGEQGPPSPKDDTWAASVVLYEMLAGKLPPAEGVSSVDDLKSAGIEDGMLAEALVLELSPDESKRSAEITPLKRELARWFVDHADEESSVVSRGPTTSSPPPLPPSTKTPISSPSGSGPPAVSSSTAPPPAKSSRGLIFGLAAVVFVLGIAGAWVAFRPKQEVVEIEKPTATAPEESAKAIDLSEVAVMGQKETTTCVSAHLPSDTFQKEQDLEWVCKERDPRKGADLLRVAVVKGAGGTVTEASKLFSKLSWYDMAVFASARAGCCADAEKIQLPDPADGCDRMDDALDKLGLAVTDATDLDEPLQSYQKVVECELEKKRASLYRRDPQLSETSAGAFKELIEKSKPQ